MRLQDPKPDEKTDSSVVPVATPTRAMLDYWSKFKVSQSKHMSPTSAASAVTSSGEPSQASPQQAGTSSQVPAPRETPTAPVVPTTTDVEMNVTEGSAPAVPPAPTDAVMASPEGSMPTPSDDVVTVPESPQTSVEPNARPTSVTVAPTALVMAPPGTDVNLGGAPGPAGPSVSTSPVPSPTGVISAALARANTVDLVGGAAPTAPGSTSAPSAPAPTPADTSSALGFERVH